jgi:hypothetical protein
MIEKLKKIWRNSDNYKESDSEYDGAFSYAAETHAFTHGVYDSLTTKKLKAPKELPDNEDVEAEPHYYKGGYLVGTAIQFVGSTGVVYYVVEVL